MSFFGVLEWYIFDVKWNILAETNLVANGGDTHFENVLAYYLDDKRTEEQKLALLSPFEIELKKRWEAAFQMMLEFRSQEDAVKKLVAVFGVSKATAYRDVKRTEMLFGSFKRFDKEAWRYIQIERKHKYLQIALKDKNMEMVYKFDQAIDKLLGLDKEDSPIDLDKIASQNYDIIISNKQARLIKMIHSQGGVVNMNVSDTIDIDFEELKNKDEDEQE